MVEAQSAEIDLIADLRAQLAKDLCLCASAHTDWRGVEALLDRLERAEAAHAALHRAVQSVYDLQCPPMPAENYVDRGAHMAHEWWSTVLGGVLTDPRYRPGESS